MVEVLAASMIGVFIALVAMSTLRAISASAEMVDSNINVAAEVRFASSIISRDLLNLYRDTNIKNTRLIGRVIESDEGGVSCLTFYTVGKIKARNDQPEGDVYEAEYFLLQSEEKSVLCRRLWPNPDPNEVDLRGILTVIAEDIEVFAVRYFDGEEWQIEWPEEMESVPELVEVNIAAKRPGRTDMTVESFIVNFPRSGWREAGASEGIRQEESGAESEMSR